MYNPDGPYVPPKSVFKKLKSIGKYDWRKHELILLHEEPRLKNVEDLGHREPDTGVEYNTVLCCAKCKLNCEPDFEQCSCVLIK